MSVYISLVHSINKVEIHWERERDGGREGGRERKRGMSESDWIGGYVQQGCFQQHEWPILG